MNRADDQAFPRPASSDVNGRYLANEGATLREYLTGQALIGVMALNAGGNPDYQLMADHVVAMADLTLIALDRVTHEDNAARILRSSADPFARDEDRGQTQEDDKEPVAAGNHGTSDPTLPEAAGPTSAPEGEPTKTDGEDEKTKA